MSKNNKFFTITTPRKDGQILEDFLSEFGYSAFEKENREDDTRRSVAQISPNSELIEEVADFCKDNKCTMQLIYKRENQLVRQTFQSDKVFKPKTYGTSEGQALKDETHHKEKRNIEQKAAARAETAEEFIQSVVNQVAAEEKAAIKPQRQQLRNSNNKKTDNKKTKNNIPKTKKPNPKNTVQAKQQNTEQTKKKSKTPNEKANENNPNHPSYKGKKPVVKKPNQKKYKLSNEPEKTVTPKEKVVIPLEGKEKKVSIISKQKKRMMPH